MHKAKKSLGQNFLKSEAALRAIIEAGEIKNTDTILEIGPGKGALTERLLEKAGKVLAVEKDQDLILFLQEKFSEEIKTKKLILIEGDILDIEIKENKYKVIANIPYNITGAILKKFLSGDSQPELMVLLVQKEVAERIVTRDGKESLLSISVKAYGEPKYITKVAARYFSPAPKVDSAVIKISNISKNIFTQGKVSEQVFWELVRAGFAHKRKKLIGNLKTNDKSTNWERIFEKTGIKIDIRPEKVSVEEWVAICINKNIGN